MKSGTIIGMFSFATATTWTFRQLFGDETADYGWALQSYYANGAPANWQERFVSSYASSHPFAETWAHYLHIVDTLEMARAFGLYIRPPLAAELDAEVDFNPYRARDVKPLIDTWMPLSNALNGLNRSMGQLDVYPFVLSPRIVGKLGLINDLVHGNLKVAAAAESETAGAG